MKLDPRAYRAIYTREENHWWFVGRRKILASLLAPHAARGNGWKILDVGCGTGGNFPFLGRFGQVEGCDYSEEALRYCRLRGLENVRQADVCDLPYPDRSFHLVTCLDVIEHIRLDHCAFRELNRVLVDGGLLLVTLPAMPELYSDFDCLAGHLRRYTREEVGRLLDRSGFEKMRITCYTFLAHPVVKLYIKLGDFTGGRARYTHGMDTLIPGSNAVLKGLMSLESLLVSRFDLPLGASLAVLARKVRHFSRDET
ncbi:MAG: class I SAM-dependent methyltransferase [Candidatus Geothermincolales bacterium]